MRIETYLRDSARRLGDRVALVTPERRLTYTELDTPSDALAAALQVRGVKRDFRCGAYNDDNAMLPLEHLNAFCRRSVEALARRHDMVVETGSYGGTAVFLDASNRGRLLASARQTVRRLLKDLYVQLVPGRTDIGLYVLTRRA